MIANRQNPFEPDYAVPPGATLEETMESLGMSQRDLADRTGLTVQTLNRIFKGEQPITYETANRLELVTGIEAAFWNNLETQYRGQLAKIEPARQMQSHVDWLKTIPVKELVARQAIPAETHKVVILREVLRFYGVILHDSKKERFIDDGKDYREKPEEQRANEFAANILIPSTHHAAIKAARSAADINRIAASLNLSSGIVAGRFQFLTQKWSSFNGLITKFDWDRKSASQARPDRS